MSHSIQPYFSPIPLRLLRSDLQGWQWQHRLSLYVDEFPTLFDADIALIGLDESANEIRRALYQFAWHSEGLKIVDLGNLTTGVDAENEAFILQEISRHLDGLEIAVIWLGGHPDHFYHQYASLGTREKWVRLVYADSRIDLTDGTPLHRIISHEPNYLYNISHIGYQSYLVDPAMLSLFQKLYFDAHRIGFLKQFPEEVEPLLREADLLAIHLNAIRLADAPGQRNGSPSGFTGEEMCRITRYAGLNNELRSLSIFGFLPHFDSGDQTAHLMAQMIWYFAEGFTLRVDEHPHRVPHEFQHYRIDLEQEDMHAIFYKSKRTGKWWMELLLPGLANREHGQKLVVPCSYSDYQLASTGEVPEVWFRHNQKMQ